MNDKIEYRNDTEIGSNPDFHTIGAENSSLEGCEARLRRLDDLLGELTAESSLTRPKNRPAVSDAALDLQVKLDAVRWMLRVARHLSGPARERVILTITNSLAQLEKAIEPAVRAA